MNSLPQEIFDTICADYFKDQLDKVQGVVPYNQLPVNRPLLATVSRKWQHAVERQSFARIYLKSTDLEAFRQIVTGYRRRFVKWVRYTIILPDYDLDACTRFECETDRHLNNQSFTAAMAGIFRILHSWGPVSDVGGDYSIHFRLEDVYSPMDSNHRQSRYPVQHESSLGHAQTLDVLDIGVTARDMRNNRFIYSHLHLLHPRDLPTVRSIITFSIDQKYPRQRKIAPQTAIEILGKLPSLCSWWLNLSRPPASYPALCRASYYAFTQALERVSFPPSLAHVYLFMLPGMIENQSWQPSRLVPLDERQDPVSRLLRMATADLPRLYSLSLQGSIDPSFLWPHGQKFVKPFWQNLRELQITFDLTTPFGEWYFQRDSRADIDAVPLTNSPVSETQMPPGYGFSREENAAAALLFSTREHQSRTGAFPHYNKFRVRVDEQRIVPLIEAFCQACCQMPSLNRAFLMTRLFEPVEFRGAVCFFEADWGLFYSAPGSYHATYPKLSYPAESAHQRTLTADVRDWRLPEHVYDIWKEVGSSKYKGKAVERYIDSWGSTKPQILDELAQENI